MFYAALQLFSQNLNRLLIRFLHAGASDDQLRFNQPFHPALPLRYTVYLFQKQLCSHGPKTFLRMSNRGNSAAPLCVQRIVIARNGNILRNTNAAFFQSLLYHNGDLVIAMIFTAAAGFCRLSSV